MADNGIPKGYKLVGTEAPPMPAVEPLIKARFPESCKSTMKSLLILVIDLTIRYCQSISMSTHFLEIYFLTQHS